MAVATPRSATKATRCAGIEGRGAAPPSDEALLARYRDSRQPEDFAELMHRHSGALGRYLARYLGDESLAEDVLQDTFLQVHAKCGLYCDGWPARPWLYAIAVHRAIDALRRARRMPSIRLEQPAPSDGPDGPGALIESLADEDLGPLEVLQEEDRRRWVRDSVARLPEIHRQVLALAYDRDLPYAEIARLLDIPEGTVKSRMHAALSRLRAMAGRGECAGRP